MGIDVNTLRASLLEPRKHLLKQPSDEHLLYKIMSVENFDRSLEGNYLYFNKVDSYSDFPGADAFDSSQLPLDEQSNKASTFEGNPSFSAFDYYNRCRSRTYACCFSLNNSKHIWKNYGNSVDSAGKVCLVFNFGRLRNYLNEILQRGGLLYRGVSICPLFSIDYGIVDYVERNQAFANQPYLPNPMTYVYLKDRRYESEAEFRIALSAVGIGHFALGNGELIEFGQYLEFAFDFKGAFNVGAIRHLIIEAASSKRLVNLLVQALGKRKIETVFE